jgi:beta-lactamase regulating signal transducer with metallopeptidase domain
MIKITKAPEQSKNEVPILTKKTPRNTKTYPKSSLKTQKIIPVKDPAKAPPRKKGSRKFTMRLNLKNKKVKDLKPEEVDEKLKELKIKNIPSELKEEVVKGAIVAGFVSSP